MQIVGVFDLGGNPWCMPCLAKKGMASTSLIRAGDQAENRRCRECKIRLKDVDQSKVSEVSVFLSGDGCWPDLDEVEFTHLQAPKISFARLKGGMRSGLSSVSIRIDPPGERTIVVEVSMQIFMGVAAAFQGAELRDAGSKPQDPTKN